eukprot:COSAG01_NODE_3673_length_5808_cov_15.591872_5_plen_86_part_00
MRRPERFLHVSGWSIVFFTVCYMAVGVCGNICYAGHVAQELAANFNDTTVNNVATVLCVSPCCAGPCLSYLLASQQGLRGDVETP